MAEPTTPTTETTTPPQTEPATKTNTTSDTGGTQNKDKAFTTIPTNAISRMKADARRKGRDDAAKENEAKAKELGFRSYDEMLKAAVDARKRGGAPKPNTGNGTPQTNREPKPQQPRQGQPGNSTDKDFLRLQQENQRMADAAKTANLRRANEEKRRRQAQAELDAERAQNQLLIASRSGVQPDEVHYAVQLLQRELADRQAGKSEAEREAVINGFDEEKFFAEDLRARKPYLYGAETKPANTSAQTQTQNSHPPKPNPSQNQPPPKKRLPDMTPAEVAEYYKNMGLRQPGVG